MITIIHPSRSRPAKAYETMYHWISNCSKSHTIEYILSVDSTDPQLNEYIKTFQGLCRIVVSDNRNLVDATNKGAKLSTGEIMVLVSDDFECHQDWDVSLVNAFKDRKCCVLKTFDGIQKWIVTLPIMDREYYLAQGYFYFPEYTHMFCDTDMTHKADIEKKLLMRNDILFRHAHYSVGGMAKDAVNIKADSTWAQGERVYLQRVKEKFGIADNSVDVMNLNNEAGPHRDWLKSKLA